MPVRTLLPGCSAASQLKVTYRMDRRQPRQCGRPLDFEYADGYVRSVRP